MLVELQQQQIESEAKAESTAEMQFHDWEGAGEEAIRLLEEEGVEVLARTIAQMQDELQFEADLCQCACIDFNRVLPSHVATRFHRSALHVRVRG